MATPTPKDGEVLVTQLGRAYDVIFDVVGKSSFSRSLRTLKPVVDRTYPLAHAAAAHRYVETGQKAGSIALVMQG